jgi:hypothetical protein
MSIYNHSIIDTTPDAGGLFSPPAGFNGTSDEYMDLMRHRYQSFKYQQLFGFQIRFMQNGGKVKLKGAFSNEAKAILEKLNVKINLV